jgi:pimeloyl-ACP methyl ester carboxylesterase
MRHVTDLFDRSGRIKRPPLHGLLREGWSRLAYRPTPPDPGALPNGQGHTVLIIPGFLTSDITTRPLRRFLTRCGYSAQEWRLGMNLGPTPRIRAGLRCRVEALRREAGGPISLVGVSLGGVLACDLAYERPSDIRHVVTMASPVRFPTASPLEPLIRVCAMGYEADLALARLAQPLPVPSTAIYTRDDGMVAWQTCRRGGGNGAEFEVRGSHVAICRNPQALRIVAQRLAPAEDGQIG